MNYTIFLLPLLLLCACENNTKVDSSADAVKEEVVTEVTVPETNASLKELHWTLRSTLRMELPTTYPESRGGRMARKSYSFDIESTADNRPMWVIPEKLHDAESNELYAGGKYLIPFLNVDLSATGLTYAENKERAGIVIKARPGASFVFHPYSNEPDREVTSVLIGWYDRLQDATLGRAMVQLRQLSGKMDTWQPE